MPYSIGVDLGTTSLAVAVGDELGTRAAHLSPHLVEPSVAFVAADGAILTGQGAIDAAHDDPTRLVRGFKRRLGDPTPVFIGGVGIAPEALLAAQLRDVVAAVTEQYGEEPERVVVTCPAAWGPYRREQFARISELSGVRVDEIVADAVAAATFFARDRRLGEGAILAVFDLGGRTTDAAVLRVGSDGPEVLGTPEGIEHLGGDDFDDAVRGLLDQRLGGRISALDPADPADAATLVSVDEASARAKEALSVRDETVVRLDLDGAEQAIALTRPDVERSIRPMVTTAVAALQRSIASAGVDPDDVDVVVLAGGSARIPLVAEEVSSLGRPVAATHHPKFTVALGAAERARARAAAGRDVRPTQDDPSRETAGAASLVPTPTVTGSEPRPAARGRVRRRSVLLAGLAAATIAVVAVAVAVTGALSGRGDTPTAESPAAASPVASAPPTVVAVPAPPTAGGETTTATLAFPILTESSTTTGLDWYVQSNDASGVWGITPLAEGEASRPNLALTQTAEGFRAVWTGDAPAQLYAQSTSEVIDLDDIAADDGALVFDVTRNSGEATFFEVAAHCGYPCGGAVDITRTINGVAEGATERVIVPAACFTVSGLTPGAVDTPFLAFGTGALDLTFSDVRWEDLVGDDPSAVRCSP
ncbi:Hsp70 family protein [Microbacterium enclense]|uniref:Hsp70 family protein n=1 Tax=Microbacterium enclense TaxID=993073 RepID=UPI0036D9CA00